MADFLEQLLGRGNRFLRSMYLQQVLHPQLEMYVNGEQYCVASIDGGRGDAAAAAPATDEAMTFGGLDFGGSPLMFGVFYASVSRFLLQERIHNIFV